MRAARYHRYGPADVLQIDDVAVPEPRPRDVLVEVHAAAINPVDTKIRAGYQRTVVRKRLPTIPGMDVSGVVTARGAEVTRFAVGDAVYGSPTHKREGTCAEFVVVDERELALKPSNLDHVEAASIPLVGLTAWNSLITGTHLKAGERLLVHAGSGGVGTFTIQLAKHLGAWVATTCSGRNAELVTRLGADRVVDYTKEAFEEVLEPLDVVVDALGGEITDRSLAAVRRGGRVSTLNSGLPEYAKRFGPTLGVLAVAVTLLRRKLGARLRGKQLHMALREARGDQLEEITKLIEAGGSEAVIDRRFPLEDIVEAHRAQESGRARGKLIIELS